MSDISFTSVIRPVSLDNFNKLTANIINNVSEWKVEGAKKGISAKTDRILDCTAMGITDGENVFLMHIIPDFSSDKKYFEKIVNKIKENVDLTCKHLQAILVGSKEYSKESQTGYKNFARFLKENKIPFSELKGGDTVHKIAYQTNKDEWLVTNYDIDSLIRSKENDFMRLLKLGFDDVRINKLDEVI